MPQINLIIPKNARKWKGIVIHHSTTADNVTRDADSIAKYHTSYRVDFTIVSKAEFLRRKAARQGKVFELPWTAVGYHSLIERVGEKIELIPGRPLSMRGAHAGLSGNGLFNLEYIGICAIGNYDQVAPPPLLWDFTKDVAREYMRAFNFPREQVIGHWEVYDRAGVSRQKTCPGKLWSMDLFRKEL